MDSPICNVGSFLGSTLHLNLMFSFSAQLTSLRCSTNTGSPKAASGARSVKLPLGASNRRIFSRAPLRSGVAARPRSSRDHRVEKKQGVTQSGRQTMKKSFPGSASQAPKDTQTSVFKHLWLCLSVHRSVIRFLSSLKCVIVVQKYCLFKIVCSSSKCCDNVSNHVTSFKRQTVKHI